MTFEDHLSIAAARVADHIADSVSDEDGCKHEFSERFERNMQEFIDQWEKKKRHPVLRRVLLIAAAILLAFGILMASNSEIRAAVTGWFKDQYYNFTVYKFTGSAVSGTDEDEMPQFELTWIPEGYEYYKTVENGSVRMILYLKNDRFLALQCIVGDDGTALFIDTDDYVTEEIMVGKCIGEIHISPSDSEGSVTVWQDEATGILLSVDAPEDKETLIKIAESVKKVDE